MAEVESAVQEQIDELRDALHGVRRMLVANGGGNPYPAPAPSHAGDAAILDALHELTDEVRRLRTNGVISEADAERIALSLESHFAIEEEEPDEPASKGKKANAKGNAKPKGEPVGDEEQPRRRGYFRERDAE